MRRWGTTAAVLLVYGLGALSGWVGKGRLDVYAKKFQTPVTFPQQGPSPFQQIVDGDLDLTPEQRTKVDQILSEAQQNAQKIRLTINPQIRELKLTTFRRVEAELTLEQRRQLRIALQFLRNQQKRNSPPPPPPGDR